MYTSRHANVSALANLNKIKDAFLSENDKNHELRILVTMPGLLLYLKGSITIIYLQNIEVLKNVLRK